MHTNLLETHYKFYRGEGVGLWELKLAKRLQEKTEAQLDFLRGGGVGWLGERGLNSPLPSTPAKNCD